MILRDAERRREEAMSGLEQNSFFWTSVYHSVLGSKGRTASLSAFSCEISRGGEFGGHETYWRCAISYHADCELGESYPFI